MEVAFIGVGGPEGTGWSASRESTDIKVEEQRGSLGNVRGIGVSPYHHYNVLRGLQ